jgi:hypothetical protein
MCQTVKFIVTAIVQAQIDMVYPTIEAVCELLMKTEKKKERETWQRPHPKKIKDRSFQSVLTKKFILNQKAAVNQYIATVTKNIDRLNIKFTNQ